MVKKGETMLKVILIIIGIMFFVVLGVFFNFGAFTKVIVKEKEINNVPEKRIEYVSAIDPVFPDFEDF